MDGPKGRSRGTPAATAAWSEMRSALGGPAKKQGLTSSRNPLEIVPQLFLDQPGGSFSFHHNRRGWPSQTFRSPTAIVSVNGNGAAPEPESSTTRRFSEFPQAHFWFWGRY